jgi:chain length determinant protein tyrosine kinase EpsG
MTTQSEEIKVPSSDAQDRAIGDIIKEANNLSADQVQQILALQRKHGIKFGEAAVQLGLAKREDVLWALSQQFHYPYAIQERNSIAPELVVANSPFSEEAEAFRNIRSQLIANVFGEDNRRTISVVSPNIGDGKSFFAANLAVAFSQLGARTLIVDADMRTPRQHEIFSVEPMSGLSGVLSGRSSANLVRPIEDLPSLYVLPVGTTPPNPPELAQSNAFNLLMSELQLKFDYVIVDTPAAEHGSDFHVIAGKCGAALAVNRKGHSKATATKDMLMKLSKRGTKVVGVVLNEH